MMVTQPLTKAVEKALRKTTETLAAELARPTRQAPEWTETEWQTARAVSAIHGVSSLLSSTLLWEGPTAWERFLQEQRVHTTNRHRRMEQVLQALGTRAREEGVPMVALKGAALHAIGLYSAGERPMADLDLLVRERDLARSVQILECLGFHESFACSRHRTFVPNDAVTTPALGEHSRNSIKIELHDRVAEMLPLRPADISELLIPSRPHPGVNPYPSRAALMIHLLLHAAGAMISRSLRLIHLHDIALLGGKLTEGEWDDVLKQDRGAYDPWWALPPLALVARYYPSAIPTDALAAARRRCPWLLKRVSRYQCLSDVSLSYPWIEPFPGIEWSRSAGELVNYVAKRIVPDSEQVSLRKSLINTDLTQAESSWAHLSQGRRVLCWLVSRPARPGTLHAVREALVRHR